MPVTSASKMGPGFRRGTTERSGSDSKAKEGEKMRFGTFSGTVAAFLAGAAFVATPLAAQGLQKIVQKGELVVGAKAEYKPFGYRDPSGKIVGFEIDVAQEIADAIGVKLKLEPVQDANRIPFLTQGKVDLVIATMNDTPERRREVGLIEPSYYGSGANVLAAKSAGLKNWEQLRGQKVCGVQGSIWNKIIGDKYGPEIVAFRGTAEAETALVQGSCVAWVYGNTSFAERLADKEHWGGYEMPLPTLAEAPWGIAVPLAERDKGFGRLVAGLLYGWHRSGHLVELEKKWNIPPSPWLAAMHAKLSADVTP